MKGLIDFYKERGERIALAAKRAGLSPGQVAKKMGWLKTIREAVFSGEAVGPYSLEHSELCKLAWHLVVDARWLAIGVQSPAGAACVAHLRNQRKNKLGRFDRITQEDFDKICETLELTPQPETGFPAECRYCHCTEFDACPEGCTWADDDSTICTACLEPPEVED